MDFKASFSFLSNTHPSGAKFPSSAKDFFFFVLFLFLIFILFSHIIVMSAVHLLMLKSGLLIDVSLLISTSHGFTTSFPLDLVSTLALLPVGEGLDFTLSTQLSLGFFTLLDISEAGYLLGFVKSLLLKPLVHSRYSLFELLASRTWQSIRAPRVLVPETI